VAYTGALVDDLIDEAASTDVVRQQVADPSVNVLTGKAFTSDDSDSSDDGSTAGANATTAETDTTTQSAFVSKEAAETVAATAVGTYHPSDNQLMHAERATASGSSMGQVVDEVGTSAGTATTTGSAAATTGSASTGTAATTGAATSPTTPDAATTGISDAELAQVISELTAAQRQTLLTSLLSGMTDDQKAELVKEFGGSSTDVSSLTDAQRQALLAQMMASMSDEEKAALIKQYGGSSVDTSAIEQYAQQYAEQYVSEHASELVQQYLSSLSDAEVAALMGGSALDLSSVSGLSSLALSQDQLEALVAQYSDTTPSSYDDVLSALGYVDRAQPSEISIYPTDFDGKEQVSDLIDAYNAQVSSSDDKVTYTDLVGTMTSSVTEIVDTISTVLIAFVAISLVVSSIMIAIITYISVLERTKEIGVLRALGASKGDVSKIFNAETFIEGLISGLLGIGVTLLLSIPINAVVESQLNVANISQLTPANAAVLIGLSVALTLIAGLIPSRIASKKDPAVALRSE
jgi:DNA-directed RNA polymerase specialized sigma24 family protein